MWKIPLAILSLLISINTCQGLYSSKSNVVKLTKDNFKKLVLDTDELWLVEFFAPWCGHCKQLAPAWEESANRLKGVVKVGAVDMTTDQDVGAPYGIQGFPTIKFFGFNKQKPIGYESGRDADTIVNYAVDKVGSEIRKRGKGGASSDNKKSESTKKASSSGGASGSSDKDVVVLNAQNFDELVLGSKDIWFVEFYAPWCGHCKKLEPEWNIAATKLKGQVKLGKVDATVESELAQRFGVKGYPTIRYWDYGEGKRDSSAQEYQSGRDADSIIATANQLLEKADIIPDIHEIYNQKVYDNNCQGQKICVITFLPNIYDSNANERKLYIERLQAIAKKNRRHPFVFFWLQAGDQLDLEKQLNLGFGFPAVVAVAPAKNKLAIMKGSFAEEKLSDFLNDLINGRASLEDVKKLAFKKADKWDGQDAPPLELGSDDL